jgi:hypothetical protein
MRKSSQGAQVINNTGGKFCHQFTSVVDTDGKYANGVNNTTGKFAAGVNDTGGNLPSVSMTLAARGQYQAAETLK